MRRAPPSGDAEKDSAGSPSIDPSVEDLAIEFVFGSTDS